MLPNIVMTGYSGFLGQAFTRYWAENSLPFNIIALHRSRSRSNEVSREKYNVISDELEEVAKNNTGARILTADLYHFLDGKLDVEPLKSVLHFAGLTKWSASRDEAFAANVELTERLCNMLAERHPETRIIFSSTSMTRPITSKVSKKYAYEGRHFHNYYEMSKYAAEKVVRDSGLPYVTVRPPLISGERNSGWCINYQGIYNLFRLFARGYLPVLVVENDLPINSVPCDEVVYHIHQAITKDDVNYCIELRAGESALKANQLVPLVQERINVYRERNGSEAIPAIRMINYEQWLRLFRPMITERATRSTKLSLDVIDNFLPYLNLTDYDDEGQTIVSISPGDGYYARIIDYWVSENEKLVLKKPYKWTLI